MSAATIFRVAALIGTAEGIGADHREADLAAVDGRRDAAPVGLGDDVQP